MMKIYLKKSAIIKNVLNLHYIFPKSFSVEGKLKSKESNLKNKNYSVFDIFEEEKAEENNFNRIPYQNKFYDDIPLEETEKIIEIPEKNKDFHEIPKEQIEQPLIKLEKSKLNENSQNNSMKPTYTKQTVDHEQLIDRMLLQKTNSYQQNYNYNNNSNGTNYTNKNQNNYNNMNEEYNSNTQKRQRISFLREGMLLNLYMKKSSNSKINGKSDGYLFLEVREYSENFEEKKLKDPRFIILNPINCAKFLLLDPKICNHNELQQFNISIKNRMIEIEQNKDKTYTLTITILLDGSEMTEIPGQKTNKIISRIELNPEDVILLQKFVNKSIDEILML